MTFAERPGRPVATVCAKRPEESVDIILPVAGFGTRLRPQTWTKPKPLVSVAGKPMLEHVLDRVLPLDPDQGRVHHRVSRRPDRVLGA